jgi:uncharacterized protein (DUF58 family)
MHLAHRAYVLLVLTAVLAIAGIWSGQDELQDLWHVPAGLLLVGLAWEAWSARRTALQVELDTTANAYLGRTQPAAVVFRHANASSLTISYLLTMPAGVLPAVGGPRSVQVRASQECRESFELVPVGLGVQRWPAVELRILGRLRLAWWSRSVMPDTQLTVVPDVLSSMRSRPSGRPIGERPRRKVGAGAEVHALREYRRGDPPAWIDWKATARKRALMTREFTEDQHLDVMVAIDAGRSGMVRGEALDRFGVYVNLAARLAETVVQNDDRIGLLLFADRVLGTCPPGRGRPAVINLRQTLAAQTALSLESDPLAAAVRMRSMLARRSLIIVLTDPEDVTAADALARAVRLLMPPHLVVVAGVRSQEIAELATREARSWLDPWVALAAREHQQRAAAQRLMLERLGVPAIAAGEQQLESAVLSRYARLRRSRRV